MYVIEIVYMNIFVYLCVKSIFTEVVSFDTHSIPLKIYSGREDFSLLNSGG